MSFKIKGDCSFIDEFLDLTVNLPREIVRLLKLIKEVDEKSNDINILLKESREKYLSTMKTNQIANNDLLNKIKEYNSTAISLCDYKQELIKEINYLLFHFYGDKLNKVIEQGEKECKELQIRHSNSSQNNFSYTNYYDKSNEEYSSTQNKKKINSYQNSDLYSNASNISSNKILGHKNRRNQKLKSTKKNNLNNNLNNNIDLIETEITQNSQLINNIQEPLYCICKKQKDVKMICCDNPKCKIQWFHCDCMNVSSSDEDKEWFCSDECKKQIKEDKKKKKKSLNNLKN